MNPHLHLLFPFLICSAIVFLFSWIAERVDSGYPFLEWRWQLALILFLYATWIALDAVQGRGFWR